MTTVTLLVNGKAYGGWEEISITKSLEAIAGAFSLTIANKWFNLDDYLEIEYGDACTLKIDKETIITGYVDRVSAGLSPSGRRLSVSGRDKTGDLVDCSAVGPRQYKRQTLASIAKSLCAPFGVPVQVLATADAPIDTFAIEPGQTVVEALRQLSQKRGLLLSPDGHGGLVIQPAVFPLGKAGLKEGENLMEVSSDYDYTQVFSQITSHGADETSNKNKVVQTDPRVKRFRPLEVSVDGKGTLADCDRRAKWELASRNGKVLTVSATVPGWRSAGGLWAPGVRVPVVAPTADVEETLVIAEVTLQLSYDEGFTTELKLNRPEAFYPEPQAEPAPKKKRGRKKREQQRDDSASNP